MDHSFSNVRKKASGVFALGCSRKLERYHQYRNELKPAKPFGQFKCFTLIARLFVFCDGLPFSRFEIEKSPRSGEAMSAIVSSRMEYWRQLQIQYRNPASCSFALVKTDGTKKENDSHTYLLSSRGMLRRATQRKKMIATLTCSAREERNSNHGKKWNEFWFAIVRLIIYN